MSESCGNHFVWYELLTTDAIAAEEFYSRVIGWQSRNLSTPGSAYSVFSAGDTPIAGVVTLPEEAKRAQATPHWMGYVEVGDPDSSVREIVRLGGGVRVPPTTIPNVSRFAIVADPQNATFAIIRGAKPSATPRPQLGTPGRVGWHELFATDWEAALTFYRKVFGWEPARTDTGPSGAYQQISAGGEVLGAMSAKPDSLSLPFWLYYFNVSDIDAAVERVKKNSGDVLYGPGAVPGGVWIAHCRDPQGAVFGLLDRRSRKAIETFALNRKHPDE